VGESAHYKTRTTGTATVKGIIKQFVVEGDSLYANMEWTPPSFGGKTYQPRVEKVNTVDLIKSPVSTPSNWTEEERALVECQEKLLTNWHQVEDVGESAHYKTHTIATATVKGKIIKFMVDGDSLLANMEWTPPSFGVKTYQPKREWVDTGDLIRIPSI